jgi:hypothetical protein
MQQQLMAREHDTFEVRRRRITYFERGRELRQRANCRLCPFCAPRTTRCRSG